MTEYAETTFSTPNDDSEQIKELRHVLAETMQKLKDVREQTSQAREALEECTKETKQRLDLLMANSEVIDVLQEFGQLLEKEHSLKEQLTGQSEENRYLWKELQDRNEAITNRAQSLTREINEVTEQLEALAHFKTKKSPETKQGSKPKRRQTKPK